MTKINKNPIYRLFSFLSKKRKIQIFFLIFLQIINGISESLSIATLIPFISLIALKKEVDSIPIVGNILNFFGINDTSKSFFLITLFLCIFIILSTFFRLFNLRYTYRLIANLEIELSNKILKENILQSYRNYCKKNSSEIISITTEKVSSAANSLSALLIAIGSAILGVFIVGSLLVINWQISFAAICFISFTYLVINKRVSRILLRNGKIISSMSPKRISLIQEVFLGFRDIVVNQTEKIYIQLYKKIDSKYKLGVADSKFISTIPRYLIEGIVILIIAILGYSVSSLNFNIISFLPIIGSAIYSFQKLLPIIGLTYASWAQYLIRFSSVIDVVEELEFNKANKNYFKKKDKLVFKNSVIFKNIYFGYDSSNYILKDVNFKINKGEHVGIFGETGSGKSTLLDLLLGLQPPSKGEIFIDDISLYGSDTNFDWISKIACVSQNIFLREGTIAENIAYGESKEEFDFELLERASRIAQIYEFINQSEKGFETNVGEGGILLSGGQRQRIAIARAIYKSREILVLDEATSALDNFTEEKIINSIKNNSNLTILMVNHRLKNLKSCDRLFKIKNNRLIEIDKNDYSNNL